MLSPDDRWLAYVSNESGREEIYVRPFEAPGGKWQVSTEGGTEVEIFQLFLETGKPIPGHLQSGIGQLPEQDRAYGIVE